jgi:hypothetical protein
MTIDGSLTSRSVITTTRDQRDTDAGIDAPQRGLDAHVQRHVSGRAGRAAAGQPHAGDEVVEVHELDVALVCAKRRPDAIQDVLDGRSAHHGHLPSRAAIEQPPCQKSVEILPRKRRRRLPPDE